MPLFAGANAIAKIQQKLADWTHLDIARKPREVMERSNNGCSTKPPEITVQDGSVTIVTSKLPADHQDDTLDAWFDRAQKARERMAIDEGYRKEVAKRIS